MKAKDDYNNYPQEDSQSSLYLGLNRRDFLKAFGGGLGGLYIFFHVGSAFGSLAEQAQQRRSLPADYNAFLRVAEDGFVTCYTGKIEMGQGIITGLAQMLAEELDVEVDKVKMVMGDTELCPFDMGTWGSMSTRIFGPSMLAAAAEARGVLLSMGSEFLHTDPGKLSVKDGEIFETDNPGKKVSYMQLTKGKRMEKFLSEKPKIKDYSSYKIMGKPMLRRDAAIKVKGEALYAGDYRIPGMVYAKILRPPSHGATLASVDTSAAEKIKGITVIHDKDLVAVLHENPEAAESALATIKAEYTFNEMKADDKTIFDHLLNIKSDARVINSNGDITTAKGTAEIVFEKTYYNSYVAHSAIEPHSALAWIEGDKMMVRASTQSPFGTQDTIARELGYPLDKVRVMTPFLGGGFGGKAPSRQASEAARLAKLSKKPVMVEWTRKEEFFYDTFRPAAVIRITSAVDKRDQISLWDYHEYFAGSRGAETMYDVPNQKTTSYSAGNAHPFGTGAWRAPGNNTNTFARESQIDIMASKIGMDPLEFRLKNLKDERMIRVLKAVADLFGWTPAKSPGGKGYGISCGIDAGSYVAHMAEVKVEKDTGQIKVVRVACAQEMGFCVNPEGARLQMEGCITMGLGYTLTEEVEFTGGDIKTSNWGTYKIPRFSWLPKIETLILDSKTPPQGGGEPAIIGMGAVIANAVFDATGARLYQLPMTQERVLKALSEK